jgi:hypothetical protein
MRTKETINKRKKEKEKNKCDLENLIDHPTLDTYIKKSVTPVKVWPVS